MKRVVYVLLILCFLAGLASGCESEAISEEPDQPAVIVKNTVQLTSSYLSQSGPVWSPDGTKILYETGGWETYEPPDIWVMNADGSDKRQLTDDPTLQCNPYWSPDGTKIVYESDESGNREIWVMNADGSNQTQLTTIAPGHARYPSWSPDGVKIVYRVDDEIWAMNTDGTDKRQLATGVYCPYGGFLDYSISPQGTIAYGRRIGEGSSDIWLIDLDGGGEARLTFDDADQIAPLFSPDGDKIAFIAESSEGSKTGLWVMSVDGSDKRMLVDDISPYVECWSPDGTQIAYSVNPFEYYQTFQIFIVNADGSSNTQVTGEVKPEWQRDYEVEDGKIVMLTDARWNYCPSWSPDGAKIAYTSAKSVDIPSEANIWVMTLGGVTPTPLTIFTHEDIEWLAITIALEAGSVFDNDKGVWEECTDEERAAVGWTILNRLDGLWEGHTYNTIKEVVTASGQYATGSYVPQNSEESADEALSDIPENRWPTSEILQLAIELAEGQIPDPSGGATHFFSPISMPQEGEEYECQSPIGNGVMDCNGGLHEVPGISEKVYFPSWAENGTLVWVGDLDGVRRAYFMFYRNAYSPDEEQTTLAPSTSEGIAEALQILDWRIVDGGHYRPYIEIELKDSGGYPPCDVEIILRDPYGETLVGKSIRLWGHEGHWWEPFYLDDYYLRAPTEGNYDLIIKDEEGEYITILPLEFKSAYQVVEASLVQEASQVQANFGFHFEITIKNTGNVVLYCCSIELNGNGTAYTFEPLYEPNSIYRDKAIQPGDEQTIKHYWWSHDRYFGEDIPSLTIRIEDCGGKEVVFTSSWPIINQ